MEQSVNQFTKGMLTDIHPMTQGSDSLSSCLNGTLVTLNGNEFVLQNDMGNAKLENVHLPDGFEPVGIVEHGGVIYVASYNPITNLSLIGSFPSPQRIFENVEEENLSTNEIDLNEFLNEENLYRDEHGLVYLKNTSYLYPISLKYTLHAGDKFHLFAVNNNGEFNKVILDNNNLSNYNNVSSNNEIINKYNDRYSLYFGVLDSKNLFHDYTKSLKRYKDGKMIDSTKNSLLDYNIGYFLDTYSNLPISDDKTKSNIYLERLTGYPCIKSEINVVDSVNYTVDVLSSGANLEIEELLLVQVDDSLVISSEYINILYRLLDGTYTFTKPNNVDDIDTMYLHRSENTMTTKDLDDYAIQLDPDDTQTYNGDYRIKFTNGVGDTTGRITDLIESDSKYIGYYKYSDAPTRVDYNYEDYDWYPIPKTGPIPVRPYKYKILETINEFVYIWTSSSILPISVYKENLSNWYPIEESGYYIKYNNDGKLVYGKGLNTIKLNFTINYECICNCPLLNNEYEIYSFPKITLLGNAKSEDLTLPTISEELSNYTITEFGNNQYKLKATVKYDEIEYYLTPELEYLLYFSEFVADIKNSYFEQNLYKFYDTSIKPYNGLISSWKYKYNNDNNDKGDVILNLDLSFFNGNEGNYKIQYKIDDDHYIIQEEYLSENSIKNIKTELTFNDLTSGEFYYLNIYLLDSEGNQIYTLSKNEIWILTTTLFNSDYENNTNFQNIKEKEIVINPLSNCSLELLLNNIIINDDNIFGEYVNIPVWEDEYPTEEYLSAKYQMTVKLVYDNLTDYSQVPNSIKDKIKRDSIPRFKCSGLSNVQSSNIKFNEKTQKFEVTYEMYDTRIEYASPNKLIQINVPVIKSLYHMIYDDDKNIVCHDKYIIPEISKSDKKLYIYMDEDLHGSYNNKLNSATNGDYYNLWDLIVVGSGKDDLRLFYERFSNESLNDYYFVIGMSVNDLWLYVKNTLNDYENFYMCHFQYAPGKWTPVLIQGFNTDRNKITEDNIIADLSRRIRFYCNPWFYSGLSVDKLVYIPSNFSEEKTKNFEYGTYVNRYSTEETMGPIKFKIVVNPFDNTNTKTYKLITNDVIIKDSDFMLIKPFNSSDGEILTKRMNTWNTDIFRYDKGNLISVGKLNNGKLNLDGLKLSLVKSNVGKYQYGHDAKYSYEKVPVLGESNNKDYISQ